MIIFIYWNVIVSHNILKRMENEFIGYNINVNIVNDAFKDVGQIKNKSWINGERNFSIVYKNVFVVFGVYIFQFFIENLLCCGL